MPYYFEHLAAVAERRSFEDAYSFMKPPSWDKVKPRPASTRGRNNVRLSCETARENALEAARDGKPILTRALSARGSYFESLRQAKEQYNTQAKGGALPTRMLPKESVDIDLADFNEKSVVRMQANARGFLARKQLKARVASQLQEDGMSAEEAALVADATVEQNVEDLPDLSKMTDEDVKNLTRVQANARGFLTRKKMQLKARVASQLQEDGMSAEEAALVADVTVEQNVEDLPDLSKMTDEDVKNLTRVQANARGFLTRKKMQEAKTT
ncbi:hypothetical protein NFJ02_03g101990 [Pycnococcus provasolii]